MDGNDINKLLTDFAKVNSDVVRPLNIKTMNFFANNSVKEALKSITSIMDSSISQSAVSPQLQNAIKALSQSYVELVGLRDFGYSVSEQLIKMIASMQIETMYNISQSFQTSMMRELSSCFATAQYKNFVSIINKELSCSSIKAPDVAFLRTSVLVESLGATIVYPKGLTSSLKVLNKSTARDIAKNNEIEYDIKDNSFISAEGSADSRGLNVICSGKAIFTFNNDELFSETELMDFNSFLSRTPMLAASTKTGRKIYVFLQNLFHQGDKMTGFDKDVFYHCRSHKANEMPFTFEQMLRVPNGLPWAGRYNHVGRSSYYFSDSRKGAEIEIRKHKTNNDVIQTVKLKPQKGIKLLDLSGTLARGATFLRYLRFSLSDNTDKMPREYLIPCYVSDCCKAIGIEGIKYYGSKEYNNYVAWNDGYFEFGGMCE